MVPIKVHRSSSWLYKTNHPDGVSVSGLLQPGGAQLFEAKVEAVHLATGGASVGWRQSSPSALTVASQNAALLTSCFLLEYLALNVTHVQNLQ